MWATTNVTYRHKIVHLHTTFHNQRTIAI
jgi:hypothetical protein